MLLLWFLLVYVFFFKQKTAYEMRISDWSSDVCSSDLNPMQKQHGKNNPQGMHMGDLPNLLIGTDGRGSMEITVPGADLASGSNPMPDADGAEIGRASCREGVCQYV